MTEERKTNRRNISAEDLALAGMNRLVYVKEIRSRDLPKELHKELPRELIEGLAEDTPLYAVCAADGTPLSIVDNRAAAFSGARQYNLEPVSVH